MDYEMAFRRLSAAQCFNPVRDARDLADELEVTLAQVDRAPDLHVDFLCRVVSDPALVNRPGLEYLVMALYTDRSKFSPVQLRRFCAVAVDHFDLVEREVFALAVCDFIARALPSDGAFEALSDMTALARTPQGLSGVFFGLDVLWRQARGPEGPERRAIEATAKAAEHRLKRMKSS